MNGSWPLYASILPYQELWNQGREFGGRLYDGAWDGEVPPFSPGGTKSLRVAPPAKTAPVSAGGTCGLHPETESSRLPPLAGEAGRGYTFGGHGNGRRV